MSHLVCLTLLRPGIDASDEIARICVGLSVRRGACHANARLMSKRSLFEQKRKVQKNCINIQVFATMSYERNS